MPRSVLTPDEWLKLQFIFLWIDWLGKIIHVNLSGNVIGSRGYYYDANTIRGITMQILAHADSSGKEQIVIELLYSLLTDINYLSAEFIKDIQMPETGLREVFAILNKKLPTKEADAIKDMCDWYATQLSIRSLLSQDILPRLVSVSYKLTSKTPSPASPSATKPILQPGEWFALQIAFLWIFSLGYPLSYRRADYCSIDSIREIAWKILTYADTSGKEQIVIELLYSLLTDINVVHGEFIKDTRVPETRLQKAFSILNTKLPAKEADSLKETYDWYAAQIGGNIPSVVSVAYKLALSRPSAPLTPLAPKPVSPPVATSKHLPIYLLIDSSRHISDSASFLDSGINNHLGNHLRSRPKSSVPLQLGFIAINDVSDLAVPLTEPATFHASSLVGAGACQFGRALLSLHVDLSNQLSDSKPLVFIFLAGAPNDAWQKPARQIQDLAKNGKVNVIAIGSGALADLACLKEVGAAQPMVMSGITQSNVDQVLDWLYCIIDVIMSGLESGASGAKSVPNPPACLKAIP